jgi:hypothetical protein
VESSPEQTEVAYPVLLSLSVGVGSLALILAVVAVVLLLKNKGSYTQRRYRSNWESSGAEGDTVEP